MTLYLVAKLTLVCNHRDQTFLVVGHQVCTHFRRDFVPLLYADPLQVIKVLRTMFGKMYWIKVWRLVRPLQDLNVLLLEPLFCCSGHVFWFMQEYPSTTHFQCPGWLQCPGPDGTLPRPLSLWCGAVVLSPKQNIPPNTASWFVTKELDFGHIWPQHIHTVLLWIIGGTVHVLSWAEGPCGRCRISVLHGIVSYQLFSWWLWS